MVKQCPKCLEINWAESDCFCDQSLARRLIVPAIAVAVVIALAVVGVRS